MGSCLWTLLIVSLLCLYTASAQDHGSSSSSHSISIEDEDATNPCTFRGEQVEHRKKWSIDSCTQCQCKNGTTNCIIQSCVQQTCPQGRAVNLDGICCPQCPPSMTVVDTHNLQEEGVGFTEGSSQDFSFDVDVEIAKQQTTRTIRGKRMWKVSAWLSTNADGSGKMFSFANDILTKKQAATELFKPTYPPWGISGLTYTSDGEGTCAELKYFCIKFNSGDNPAPQYSLPYSFFTSNDDDNQLVDCVALGECKGLTVSAFDWSFTDEGASLGAVSPVSLTSQLIFVGGGRDLVGEGLWRMSLYGSGSADGTGSRLGEVSQVLNEEQMASGVVTGEALSINDINTDFEIGSIGCTPEYSYVCVEFMKGDNPDPDFTLNDPEELMRSCKERECTSSAIFSSLSANLVSPNVIVEDTDDQQISVSLEAMVDPASLSVSGQRLWQVSQFFSKKASGRGRRINEQIQILDANQQDIELVTGEGLNFAAVDFDIDLTGYRCKDVPYMCFELNKNPDASLGYIFSTNPVQDPFVECISTADYCKGVTFSGVSFSRKIDPHNPGQNAALTVDANAETEPFSRQVEGTNLWQLKVFGAADKKGLNRVGPEFLQILTNEQASQSLARGGSLEFEGARTPPFDVDQLGCGEAKFLCLEFTKGETPSPDFTVEYPKGESIIKCRREDCAVSLYVNNFLSLRYPSLQGC